MFKIDNIGSQMITNSINCQNINKNSNLPVYPTDGHYYVLSLDSNNGTLFWILLA